MEPNTAVNTEPQIPVQPAIEQPTPVKNPFSKWLLIFAGLVLLAILFSGVYFLGIYQGMTQKPAAKTPVIVKSSPTPTPDPTTNWKIYTDPNSQYSVKYPSTWTYVAGIGTVRFYPPEVNLVKMSTTAGISYVLVGQSNANPEHCNNGSCPTVENAQNYTLSGIVGRELEGANATDGGNYPKKYNMMFVSKANAYPFVEIYGDTNNSIPNATLNVFTSMLSTFKFTDQTSQGDESTNWKTFTDTATGLSFKYPPSYTLTNSMNSPSGAQGVALINPAHHVTDVQYSPYIMNFYIAGDHGDPCRDTKPNILNLASGKSLDITGCGYNLITTKNITLGIRVNEVKLTDSLDKTTKEVLQILDSLQNVTLVPSK